jgi:hypothetical protein
VNTSDQNNAATYGEGLIERDSHAPDAPNRGGTARRDRCFGSDWSGWIQEGDTNLIGIAPNQFGSQLHTMLAYQQIEPAWKNGGASNCELSPIPGHVADQAIDDAIAGVEGDFGAQIGPPSVQFSTFNRHGRSRDGTDGAVHRSLSNRGAALALADALDIAVVES